MLLSTGIRQLGFPSHLKLIKNHYYYNLLCSLSIGRNYIHLLGAYLGTVTFKRGYKKNNSD